jgi:hypothetical protein
MSDLSRADLKSMSAEQIILYQRLQQEMALLFIEAHKICAPERELERHCEKIIEAFYEKPRFYKPAPPSQ